METLCLWVFGLLLAYGAVADDSAPRITHGPQSVVISRGAQGFLACRTSGMPPAQIRWMRNGVFITEFGYQYNYRIVSAKDEDDGEYRCVAMNSVGSILSKPARVSIASIEATDTISSKASFTSSEGDIQVFQKPPVKSVPRAIVSWTRDNTPVVNGLHYHITQDQRLLILDVTQELKGKYRVTLANQNTLNEIEGPIIDFKVSTNRITPEPRIFVSSKEKVEFSVPPVGVLVIPSEVHLLECIANAHPIEQLRTLWFKDGVEMEYTGLPYLLEARNRTLILDQLSPEHAGVYECRVFLATSYGPQGFDSSVTNVTVSTVPVVRPMPSERAIDTGSSLGLTCNATGNPPPQITWFRNANLLNQRGPYLEVNNSDDGGVYQCVAKNWVGEDMSSTWVNVKRLQPAFVRRPQNITALTGEQFTLECNATGAPQPKARWIFNEREPIENQGRFFIDSETRSLTVSQAEVNNTGKYTCEMSNSAGTVEASAYVTILSKTHIYRPPTDSRVILGNNAFLDCGVASDVKGGGEPEVTWLFNGRPLQTTSRVFMRANGTLIIQQARNTDIGNYTCRVASPGGSDTKTARLDVIELPHPPTFVHVNVVDEFPKTVNVSWAKSFDGNSPIISYILERREMPILSNQSEDSSLLVRWKEHQDNISADTTWILVGMLKPSVPYQFRVKAKNSVGVGQPCQAVNTIVLPAEAPGGPPTNLVVAARSPTSIVLQWSPPTEGDRNGELLGYEIRYRLAGYSGSDEAQRRVNASQPLPFILDELIVWQTYEVRVAAFNEKGVGVFSEPVIVRTKEAPPQSAPTLRQVYAINSTHIKVIWSPPDPQQINGINQGYKVEAWYNGEVEKSIRVGPSTGDPRDDQEEAFGGLQKYRTYNITVLCYTSAGDGPRSHELTVCTKQDIPGPVTNMMFESVLDSSLEVLWEPPEEPNGIIQDYTIEYWEEADITTKLTETVKSEIRTVYISGLKPLTSYIFEISASTVVGRGPPVAASIQSGIPPVLPEPPSNLAVSNIGPTSVVLQFHPGFNGNSSILTWRVESQQGREINKEKMSAWTLFYDYKVDVDRRRRPNEIPATTQSITVPNLVPYTEYRLRLVAENIVGHSEPSVATKFFETLQAPPTKPPQNVTVRSVNATALRVRWTPLLQADWCGVPKGYNISHKKVSESSRQLSELLTDHNANSFVIKNLDPFSQYEITVAAVNDVGSSPWSNASTANTTEAAPAVSPTGLQGKATTSTTIVVSWHPVEKHYRNGEVLGYKISYRILKQNSKPQIKVIDAGVEKNAYSTTLTELRKFSTYSIQVLAFTSAGDGPLSQPVLATTFEDVPGEPSNVSFPDVSTTSARIIWDVPKEPNGEILGYRVAHALLKQGIELTFTNKEVTPMDRTLKVSGLRPNEYYVFSVSARTKEGWGQEVRAQVLTTSTREKPRAPSAPIINPTQVQARQLTFTWAPGADGYAPLRYYLVQQYEPYSHKPWKTLPTKIDPQVTSFTVTGLRPSTVYQFRLEAVNDIGSSGWSAESNRTKTLPASPEKPPSGIVVTPYTTTSITVTWTPLDDQDWNGDTQTQLRGYKLVACLVANGVTSECRSEDVRGQYSYNRTIEDLVKDRDYEVRVYAVNAQGESPPSRTEKVAVGEAVPTGRPLAVQAEAISSTEIRVTWKSPPRSELNGALLGYKIFYSAFRTVNGSAWREMKEAVPVEPTQYTLMDLESYTNYSIQVLAFNPAGDGPRSDALIIQTQEDKPGPVTNLTFSQITMSSLLVSWHAPHNPNGVIQNYLLTYETSNSQGNEFSKQVRQKLNVTYLHVSGLREYLTYTFSVRAETICGYGPVLSKNVTTGPQENSPEAPTELFLKSTTISTTLSWRNNFGGKGPITGYLIEVKPATSNNEEEPWHTVVALDNGAQQSYTLSYQNLLPSMGYKLRLMARNSFGVSRPVYARDIVETPNKYYLELKRSMPFYREVWFLVMVAITTTIIIILVATILCVKGSAYKYKQELLEREEEAMRASHSALDESTLAALELRPAAGTLPMPASHRNTLTSNTGSVRRRTNNSTRPKYVGPASVTYSDEEDDVKGGGYDDESSLTEKPSDLGDTDSESESQRGGATSRAHSFVNHYANVNDTLRQSWKRQKIATKPPPSYSDQEDYPAMSFDPSAQTPGPSYQGTMQSASMNGGRVVLNNTAGSRAPLPGFTSFV